LAKKKQTQQIPTPPSFQKQIDSDQEHAAGGCFRGAITTTTRARIANMNSTAAFCAAAAALPRRSAKKARAIARERELGGLMSRQRLTSHHSTLGP
jgi:hypothetical protein